MSTAEKMAGCVREFYADRNFGWIESPHAVTCFFVHRDDVVGRVQLKPGQHVWFTPTKAERGPRAVAVELIEPVTREEVR